MSGACVWYGSAGPCLEGTPVHLCIGEGIFQFLQSLPTKMASHASKTEPAVAVQHRDGLGRCLVATRFINVGEEVVCEPPLLKVPTGQTVQEAAHNRLFGFCQASHAVQQAVLDMFAATDLEPSEVAGLYCALDLQKIARLPWARPWSLDTLLRVWRVWQLNAHEFAQDSSALFELGSKLAHSCCNNTSYTSRRHPGSGCHIALSPIAAGDLVTTNYLGDWTLMSTPQRQALLLREKLFRCDCARCAAPDTTSTVPCPGCHPRAAGLLPADVALPAPGAAVHYAVPSADHARWVCGGCGRAWGGDAVFAPEREGPRGNLLERHLEDRVRAFDQRLDDNPLTTRSEILTLFATVSRVLGIRHWATAQVLKIECQYLASELQMSRGASSAVDEVLENLGLIWRFCVTAHVPLPCAVDGGCLQALLTHAPARTLPPVLLPRCLLYHVTQVTPDAAFAALLERCRVPPTGDAAAALLKATGNQAFGVGSFSEALLFYRGALMAHPALALQHPIHSNVAAALTKLGQYAPAAAAARACVALAPGWPKGYYRLAAAQLAAGNASEARAAAARAKELAPGDREVSALFAQAQSGPEPGTSPAGATGPAVPSLEEIADVLPTSFRNARLADLRAAYAEYRRSVQDRDVLAASAQWLVFFRLAAQGCPVESLAAIRRAKMAQAPVNMRLYGDGPRALWAEAPPDPTPLTLACLTARPEVVRLLLSLNADPNFRCRMGLTPLHALCGPARLNEPHARLNEPHARLNEPHARLNEPHAPHDTQPAEFPASSAIVSLLVATRADVNATDLSGCPLFAYAAARASPAVLRLLAERCADVAARQGDGATALHAAVLERNTAAIPVLLSLGLDPQARDNDARTPADCARISGHTACARALREAPCQFGGVSGGATGGGSAGGSAAGTCSDGGSGSGRGRGRRRKAM